MWIQTIYSEGDLMHDEYLTVNRHIERYAIGELFETCDPKFRDEEDIRLRKEEIVSCIERLNAELKHINYYGDRLIGLYSYDDLFE